MAQIGTIVTTAETPPTNLNPYTTANAFMVGLSDWGPSGVSATPLQSLNQFSAIYGAPNAGLVQSGRDASNAVLWDSADAFFREGGSNLYVSRVIGPGATQGFLNLQDASGATAATLTALYYGPGSSAINVGVQQLTGASNYTVTLYDNAGNVLAISPTLNQTNRADLIAWAATTNLVTASAGTSTLRPVTIVAPYPNLSTGQDGRVGATLSYWTTALNTFAPLLGPGQVMVPGQTNTTLPGIWGALGNHAQANNRVALCDMDDGQTAAALITSLGNAAISPGLQSYMAFWGGNLLLPGIVTGTTRTIPPSPVAAALCARVDSVNNPNLAAAGPTYPLNYVSGLSTTYTNPFTGDIANLNGAGINVFTSIYTVLQNYGFVSLVASPNVDSIYWQFNHSRLRMAISAAAQFTGQQYLFQEIDGQGSIISQFNGDLQTMLLGYWRAGALYGNTASQAFTVSTASPINTPVTAAAGQLNAVLAVRMSAHAQLVQININAVPLTQNLVPVATA